MVYKTNIILYLVLSDGHLICRNTPKTDIILYLILSDGRLICQDIRYIKKVVYIGLEDIKNNNISDWLKKIRDIVIFDVCKPHFLCILSFSNNFFCQELAERIFTK